MIQIDPKYERPLQWLAMIWWPPLCLGAWLYFY
jgi:hypothetical protein